MKKVSLCCLDSGEKIHLLDMPRGTSGIVYCKKVSSVLFTEHEKGYVGIAGEDKTAIWNNDSRLSNPRGICVSPNHERVFVEDDNGTFLGIRSGSLTSYVKVGAIGRKDLKSIRSSRHEPLERYNGMSYGIRPMRVYLAGHNKHRIMVVKEDSRVVPFYGCGKPGFNITNRLDSIMLNSPCGTAYASGNRLFVSDSGNHIIREIDLNRKAPDKIYGRPLKAAISDGALKDALFDRPEDMHYFDKNLFVVDGDGEFIRQIDLTKKTVKTLYQSPGSIAAITSDDHGKIFFTEILEEEYAEAYKDASKKALRDAVSEIIKTTDMEEAARNDGVSNEIVDIITFCDSPYYLNLPGLDGGNLDLWMSQRVVLKCFYMGSRGNEDLRLSKEEWEWLYSKKDVFETELVIEKIKKKEQSRGEDIKTIRFSELILVLGRRSSKTLLASIIAVYEAYKLLVINEGDPYAYYKIPYGKELAILNVATSRDQAGRLFSEIVARIDNAPFFQGRVADAQGTVVKLYTDRDLERIAKHKGNIKPEGTIHLVCGHSNPKSLRGYAAICILFDELAFYDEAAKISGKAFYETLSPSIAQFSEYGDGVLVEISSPGPKTGIFYKLWKNSFELNGSLAIRMPTWEFNPTIDPENNDELIKAKMLDENSYKVEYGAEWPDTGFYSLYFTEELIDRAMQAGLQNGCTEHERGIPGGEYYMHVDPALTGDNYALVVVRKQSYRDHSGQICPRVILSYAKAWRPAPGVALNFPEIDVEIIKLCRSFRPIVVSFDDWNSASSMALLKRHQHSVKRTSFSRHYKQAIFQNLRDLMMKPEVGLHLYDHTEDSILLREELKHLGTKPLMRGQSIGADKRGDVPTDDLADCLAGASYLACGNYYNRLPPIVTVFTGYR